MITITFTSAVILLVLGVLSSLPAHAEDTIKVIIVAGQSNAVGYNNASEYRGGREPLPEALRNQPRIRFWPGHDTVTATNDLWTTLSVQDSGAFGPEIGLAHDLAEALPDEDLAIVKYAKGGTGIARSRDYTDYIPELSNFDDGGRNWYPSFDPRQAGTLYNALIANVRAALAALERRGKHCELVGFVWVQGEHEAGISPSMAADYGMLLQRFIGAVREDFSCPGLPVLIAGLNSHPWAFADPVRRGQKAFCDNDSAAVLVDTTDLSRDGSGGAAHFDANGMLTLGERFADHLFRIACSGPSGD